MQEECKYLGYENDWKNNPVEVDKCRELKHTAHTASKDCVHTVTCDECKIVWKYDSGD